MFEQSDTPYYLYPSFEPQETLEAKFPPTGRAKTQEK